MEEKKLEVFMFHDNFDHQSQWGDGFQILIDTELKIAVSKFKQLER